MRKTAALLMCCAFVGCKSGYKLVGESNQKPPVKPDPESSASAPVIVYKTRGDYRNLVPVTLSEDGKSIVSYPSSKDVKTATGFQTPTELHKGYLLDHRGVTKNVAFLKYSYEEYAALSAPPTLAELYSAIKDKNPLTELCDCGPQTASKNKVETVNDLIDKGQLRVKCKVVK